MTNNLQFFFFPRIRREESQTVINKGQHGELIVTCAWAPGLWVLLCHDQAGAEDENNQAGAEEENKEAGLEAAVPGRKKRRTKWLTVGLKV